MPNLTRPEGSRPEDFHVTRRGVAGFLAGAYAVAALSAEAAPVHTPADGLTTGVAQIPNGAAEPLPAYVARPAGTGRHPVVIVVNEVFGIHEYIMDVCRRLAKLGYVAVAPAFFYRSHANLPAITDMDRIMAVVKQASDAQVDGDVRATIAWIGTQPFAAPGRLGITGFCWGGAVVWRTAMLAPQVKAGVAWYGRLGTIIPRAGELRAPVLGLYGGKDQGIPQSDVAGMRAGIAANRKPAEIVVYPDAGHGFHADYRSSYDPAAATDGWQRMLAFFRAHGV